MNDDKRKEVTNISELVSLTEKLEERLREHIHKELLEYYHTTGYIISSINVGMVDLTTFGDIQRYYIVGEVKCGLDIRQKTKGKYSAC